MIIAWLYSPACNDIYDMDHYGQCIHYNPSYSILKKQLFKKKVLKGFDIIKFSKPTVTHRVLKIISVCVGSPNLTSLKCRDPT